MRFITKLFKRTKPREYGVNWLLNTSFDCSGFKPITKVPFYADKTQPWDAWNSIPWECQSFYFN